MTTGQDFWDVSVWSAMIELTVLLVGMLTANMLRRLIKPLRQSLIPSSVLGGFLILFLDLAFKAVSGHSMFANLMQVLTYNSQATATLGDYDKTFSRVMETLTYHGLGLGFVAVALRQSEREKNPKANTDVFNAGVTTVSSYLLQGVLGLAITLGLYYMINSWAASGLLLPMGFGQGPGQAYNWGHIFESGAGYNAAAGSGFDAFHYGTSFGLTIAALGFVTASIGGVFYLQRLKKKGLVKSGGVNAEEVEDLTAESITKKGEIPLSESLDKLTVQIGLVVFTYMAAYVVMYLISIGLDSLSVLLNTPFFVTTIKPLIWGFNFLIGVVMAIIMKAILKGITKRGKRQYLNNFMLSRISGVMFDLMVVASIAAINLSAFTHREFLIPLLLICIVGGVATYLQIRFITKRLYPDYQHEAFLSMYGMLTGTASTGIILVREIDPLFKTPAASNLVYQQLWAIVFGFPMLLLLGFAPIGLNGDTTRSWITLAALAALFVVMMLILFRKQIFKKKASQKL